MIPRHHRQGSSLSPEQIFSAGYRDGVNRCAPHPQFQTNTHYFNGYVEGCRSRPDSLTLIAFNQHMSLDSALQSLHLWEQDRDRLGFGAVALSFHNKLWVVLVSQGLHDAAMPF